MNHSDDSQSGIEFPALNGRTLLFLHMPKAAGTSFVDLLGRRLCPKDMLSVGLADSATLTDTFRHAERYTFVHGHFPYAVVNLFSRRPFLFTVLREPIDRAISAFQFMKQQSHAMERLGASGKISNERVSDYVKAREMTLSEFVHNEPRAAARHLGNVQVELLTCADIEKRHRYGEDYDICVSNTACELACERISMLDAFGLFDRLPESVERLAQALQTRPFGELGWCNMTRSRPALGEIDGGTIEELERLTYYDRQLYAFARELFDKRRRAMPSAPLSDHLRREGAEHVSSDRQCPSVFRSGMKLRGEGWYAAERNENRWFNWTGPGSESWIELGTPDGSEFTLQVGVLHALKPESLYELQLFVNDIRVQPEIRCHSDGHTIVAPVLACSLRGSGATNRVRLRVPYLARPCDCDAVNNDSRQLGIAVYEVALKANLYHK